MRWLPLLSRVAFICNLAFIASVLLQWKYIDLSQGVASTVLITGLFLAPFVFNPLVALCYLVIWVRKKSLVGFVPLWLACANFIFLVLQLLFALFFLHDPFHH